MPALDAARQRARPRQVAHFRQSAAFGLLPSAKPSWFDRGHASAYPEITDSSRVTPECLAFAPDVHFGSVADP